MKNNKIISIASIAIIILSIVLGFVLKNEVASTVFKTIAIVTSAAIAIIALAKGDKTYKIVSIAILFSVILGYIIPGTAVQYGMAQKGTISPVALADIFTNTIYSANVFVPAVAYVLVIGAFYAVLKKTGKYESLVNNVATTFNKNKGLFIVLTIFALGLVTLFTGEFYTLLIFVPFLISVARKLGFSKETALLSTIGSILLGNAGSMYTYYTNQILGLSVKNNILPKVLVAVVALVLLVAFILVFAEKPKATKELEKEKDNLVPLHIVMWLTFVLLILGFVNWNGYFGFKGFDNFLELLRKGTISKVPIFDALVGKTIVSFGTWQLFNASVLFIFVTIIIALIYKIKFNDLLDSFAQGFKKAFPYAMLIVLAIVVLVNVAYSGTFYTIIMAITKKTVNLLTSSVAAILTAIFCPDSINAAQFTVYSATLTKATNYQNILAITYQAVYSLFLLVSPTSILLLLGLRYTETRYKDWIKYIYKFFLVLFVSLLVVISVSVKGFTAASIIALVLLVIALALIVYLRVSKVTKEISTKKEEKKVEVKKEVKETTKKTTTKKAPAKKAPAKKNSTKKTTKK